MYDTHKKNKVFIYEFVYDRRSRRFEGGSKVVVVEFVYVYSYVFVTMLSCSVLVVAMMCIQPPYSSVWTTPVGLWSRKFGPPLLGYGVE